MMEEQVIVGTVACDYATITTYDSIAAFGLERQFFDMIRDMPRKGGMDMQYEGIRCNHGFMGKAIQQGHTHHMVRVSAFMAELFMNRIQDIGGIPHTNCTRFDIQLTIPRANSYPLLAKLAECLRSFVRDDNRFKGRKPKIKLFDNDGEIGETINIGSRESERFIRIYDKPVGGDDYIRFEAEYKGDVADSIYKMAQQDNNKMGAILKAEIARYAPACDLMADFFNSCKHLPMMNATRVKGSQSDQKTLDWLEHSVGRTVRRLQLSGKDKEVEIILRQWLEHGRHRPYIVDASTGSF
jgi:hypothetical protein